MPDVQIPIEMVSIHAPRAGRDPGSTSAEQMRRCFNPRAPCGARQAMPKITTAAVKFQSTRPVRGATWAAEKIADGKKFQSTRPVRGATSSFVMLLWIG